MFVILPEWGSRDSRSFLAGFSRSIVVGSGLIHSPKLWSSLFHIVRRYVAGLYTGWHPYTSKELKRGVGEFLGHCRKERFCPLEFQRNAEKTPGCWKIGQTLSVFSTPVSARFCLAGPRQNAQSRGNADGSKKEQDKLYHISARSANRYILSKRAQGKYPARTPQRRLVRADAHPFGWGKHRVRLYAVRTRRDAAPTPPAPKGV